MLRLILTSHSKVVVPPESGFIIWLKDRYSNWSRPDNNNVHKLSAFLDDLFFCRKFDTWQLDKQKLEGEIVFYQPTDYAELCGVVYASYGFAIGKEFSTWGDKNNFHINYMSDLLGLYKNSRFLHIARDGRDVACSYRDVMTIKTNSPYAPKLNTNISYIAHEWLSNVMKIDSFITSLPSHQAMSIRYEDLTTEPFENMKSICNWLDLDFEIEMFDFYLYNKKKKLEPELTMDWKMRTMQPINGDTVGRYKRGLSKDEIRTFESISAQALIRFSYV